VKGAVIAIAILAITTEEIRLKTSYRYAKPIKYAATSARSALQDDLDFIRGLADQRAFEISLLRATSRIPADCIAGSGFVSGITPE
jgi:hypothetical protein